MEISEKIEQLRREERDLLISVLESKGNSYEWPEDNEDRECEFTKPWIAMYMNDGVWWDLEVHGVSVKKSKTGMTFLNIIGEAYPGGDCVEIEQSISFDGGEIAFGDLAEIAQHIPT